VDDSDQPLEQERKLEAKAGIELRSPYVMLLTTGIKNWLSL
jgi:hypothetical protein